MKFQPELQCNVQYYKLSLVNFAKSWLCCFNNVLTINLYMLIVFNYVNFSCYHVAFYSLFFLFLCLQFFFLFCFNELSSPCLFSEFWLISQLKCAFVRIESNFANFFRWLVLVIVICVCHLFVFLSALISWQQF